MAIALLTDFGTRDHFVGSMKAVIAGIAPDTAVFDITHEIPPGDIESAAFTLFACFRDMPAGTIIVAVVDPGVGSDRRPIVSRSGEVFLIGPDNGIFSYIFDICGGSETRLIQKELVPAGRQSTTFHGRDIFAPAAAHISFGTSPDEFGPVVQDPVRLPRIYPDTDGETIVGRVMHLDRFGNVITNLPADLLKRGLSAEAGGRRIESVRRAYAEAGTGELFMIAGSIGLIEISMNGASAADELGVKPGSGVVFKRSH